MHIFREVPFHEIQQAMTNSTDRPKISSVEYLEVTIQRRPRSCSELALTWLPIQWQKVRHPLGCCAGEAGDDVGEPCLGVDVVLIIADHGVYEGGTFASKLGADEELGFPLQGDCTSSALCRVACHADAPIPEEECVDIPPVLFAADPGVTQRETSPSLFANKNDGLALWSVELSVPGA